MAQDILSDLVGRLHPREVAPNSLPHFEIDKRTLVIPGLVVSLSTLLVMIRFYMKTFVVKAYGWEDREFLASKTLIDVDLSASRYSSCMGMPSLMKEHFNPVN